ncbi:hypothetical protein ACP4OV_008898 [Aristida adscensionis]
MEALNSASLGAMGSVLRKLDELLRTEDGGHGARMHFRQLRDGLAGISTKLQKLSEVNNPSLTASYWMNDARELSYEVEDFLDEFFLHADSEDGAVSWMDELSGFKARVQEVGERYERYNLEFILTRPTNTVGSHHFPTVYRETESVVPVGMEGPTNELHRWLQPNQDTGDDQQLKVVSILGVEGVGKTTLAKKLWYKLRQKFDCRAFVQLAKKPDMRMILSSILSQVRPNQRSNACEMPNLIQDLRDYLQNKRYFIIIDDISSVSVWDVISRSFPEGCCSRILTTTTIEVVALACCSYEPEHVFKMEPLGDDHSKKLFANRVFGSGKECPPQFNDVLNEITRKCGGLPLAIVCVANLIARQPEIPDQWKYIQKFLSHNLIENPTSVETMKQVFNLCYSSLPRCLRTCLLYLSVYPENHLTSKDELVKQWIAEDFICTTEGKDIVEVASSHFDELVSLGLIQLIVFNGEKKNLTYSVHPMVHDFITCKSIEDNFITIIDYSQSTVALTDKIRRLSIQFGSATYATTPENIGLRQVRSLIFVGLMNCMPSVVEFKLVRVLILHVQNNNVDTSFDLKGICGLLLLKYLLVRCNATVELQDQMRCLKHLETLEIHARVAAVPSDIVHLPRLRHLRLGRKIYCYLNHLILSYMPSVKTLSLDEYSSRALSQSIPMFDQIAGMIPRPPRWIGHFRHLRILEAVVTELQMYDIDALAELWALTVLFLNVRTAPAGDTRFKRGFPALRYFKYKCSGVMLLTFDNGAMPNLSWLSIGFDVHKGGKYDHMLSGIQHLLKLQEITARIGPAAGAEESDRRAAEYAFKDTISKHPCLPSYKVQRFDRIYGEYGTPDRQNWIQEIESSNERDEVLQKQHGSEDLSDDKPGVLSKIPREDMNKHADTGSDEQHRTQAQKKFHSLLLLLTTLVVSVTYQAGLSPPGGFWLNEVNAHKSGDPILLTTRPRRYKLFFYSNSVSFLTSFFIMIVLVVRKSKQPGKSNPLWNHALQTAITLDLFGLMSAYIAGSCRELSMSIYFLALIFCGAFLVVYVTLHYKDINRQESHGFTTIRKVKKDHEVEKRHKRINMLLGILAATLAYQAGLTSPGGFRLQNEVSEKTRKRLLLVAILAVSLTYQAGLTPPGGFWLQNDESGLHAGDPILYNYPHRYMVFFYGNMLSFVLSITLVILLVQNQCRPATRIVVSFTAALLCIVMVTFGAGITQLNTATAIFAFVVAGLMSSVAFLVLLCKEQKADSTDAADYTAPETEDYYGNGKKWHAKRKYLMLLGTLVASITYQPSLEQALGRFWQQGDDSGHAAGAPVMLDNLRARSMAFFYINSISFVASISTVVMVGLLPESLHEKNWYQRVLNTTILLDLLGLPSAYMTGGSGRSSKISGYVSFLIVTVSGLFLLPK